MTLFWNETTGTSSWEKFCLPNVGGGDDRTIEKDEVFLSRVSSRNGFQLVILVADLSSTTAIPSTNSNGEGMAKMRLDDTPTLYSAQR